MHAISLVIDDDPISATYLVELLQSRGLRVEVSTCIADAELRLKVGSYQRLIVDRHLPDGDGLRWLQQRSAMLSTPALLTSGDAIDTAELPAGVGFLRKPVDQQRLLDWLGGSAHSGPVDLAPALMASTDALPLLSDQPALTRLGGRIESLQSLRQLLLQELQIATSWALQLRESDALGASLSHLHRLTAACALTGCSRLGQISSQLESSLRAGNGISSEQAQTFGTTLRDTASLLQSR